MISVSILSLVALGFLASTAAVVLPRQGAVTPLSAAQISAFKPYSFFASAAYCNPSTTINWSCGANCNGNPGFVPVASGGDGDSVQFWYVGYDPALNTVVVAHQGTDTSEIIPDLTDIDFFLTPLDQTLFPGTSGLEVHNGFGAAQAKAATDILAAVQKALAAHSTTSVTIVGHSLGAAIALIDAVYLPLHLPSTTRFKLVGYGMPRVGNPAFASYLDSHFSDLTHVNNREDLAKIRTYFESTHTCIRTAGRSLGFEHPHGEVHIQDSGAWDACAGNDNTSNLCTTGDVPTIFSGKTGDHAGPYDGVRMGC